MTCELCKNSTSNYCSNCMKNYIDFSQWSGGNIISIRHRLAFSDEKSLKRCFWEIRNILTKYRKNVVLESVNEPDNLYGLFAIINGKRIDGFLSDSQIKKLKKIGLKDFLNSKS